jgi:hypothetical protein
MISTIRNSKINAGPWSTLPKSAVKTELGSPHMIPLVSRLDRMQIVPEERIFPLNTSNLPCRLQLRDWMARYYSDAIQASSLDSGHWESLAQISRSAPLRSWSLTETNLSWQGEWSQTAESKVLRSRLTSPARRSPRMRISYSS